MNKNGLGGLWKSRMACPEERLVCRPEPPVDVEATKKIHCVSIAVRGSVCFDRPLPGQFDHLKIPPTPDQQVLATTSDQAPTDPV